MQRKNTRLRKNKRQHLQTIDRALGLLDLICRAEDGSSITELSRQTGLPKSTVHRLLATLSAHRLVVQDPQTSRYLPGIKLFELAQAVLQKLELRKQALPELRELCQRTEDERSIVQFREGGLSPSLLNMAYRWREAAIRRQVCRRPRMARESA